MIKFYYFRMVFYLFVANIILCNIELITSIGKFIFIASLKMNNVEKSIWYNLTCKMT